MNRLADFDSVKVVKHENQPQLTPGAHGCQIVKAECVTEEYDGVKYEKLYVYFDIREGGRFDNYYENKFKLRKQYNSNVKWGGILKQPIKATDGSTSPYFKGLITSVEESNPGYSWQWDERTLGGKKVGIVFREKEFKGNDGNIYTTVEPCWSCSIDSLADQAIPRKKTLDRGTPTMESMGFTPDNSERLPWE